MKYVAAIILITLFSSCAFADETAAMGAGSFTCAKFAQDYKANHTMAEPMYFSWAQGFMSAFNVTTLSSKKLFRDLGSKSLTEQQSFLRSYCDQHPLADYGTAVLSLFDTFPVKPFSPHSN